MQTTFRFVLASLVSALSALLMIALTIPLFVSLSSGELANHGFGSILRGALAMVPAVVLVGGIVALLIATLAGGAMLLWHKQRDEPLPMRQWLQAGTGAGLCVAFFVGSNDPASVRLVTALWFAAAGALAAWSFARVRRE